jgi:hypothetical protein
MRTWTALGPFNRLLATAMLEELENAVLYLPL